MQFLQKKVDSSKYSSSSVATRERRPYRVGTFNQSSLLRCRFTLNLKLEAKLRSKTLRKPFFQLETTPISSVNANF